MSEQRPSPDLVLRGEIALEQLAPLRTELASLIERGPQVAVETADLQSATVLLCQLLYSAHRMASRQGCHLAVACPADGALARALDEFGFSNAPASAPRFDAGVWTGLHHD